MTGVVQICYLSLFDIIAFSLFCYFHCDKTELGVIAFSYFVISIVIKLNLVLLLLVICYLIVSNFTTFSILSYVLCDGLFKMPKIGVLCIFIRTPFTPSDKA